MVYKDCDIGSAKPNKNVLAKYPHHLVDIICPNEVFTVADFYRRSMEIIEVTHNKNKLPIFVGGSMMYFKSLYTITESTLINSTGNFFAKFNARSVFPDAVGPKRKTIGLFNLFIREHPH